MGKKQKESIWFEKGNSLYKAERYEEAIHCYDQALKLGPRNASAWNNKGLNLSKLGRHEEAILSFKKAIELNSRYVNAWYNKAISEDWVALAMVQKVSLRTIHVEPARRSYSSKV